MSEEIIRPDSEGANGSSDEKTMEKSESRRSFLRRFTMGIGVALLAPYFLLNDRFGRNLSEAQASEIANRIASNPASISPQCVGYCTTTYCSPNHGDSCPDTYCGGGYCVDNYCTVAHPNSCWPYYTGCTNNVCSGNYCPTYYCSPANYDSGGNCGGGYCPSSYTCYPSFTC